MNRTPNISKRKSEIRIPNCRWFIFLLSGWFAGALAGPLEAQSFVEQRRALETRLAAEPTNTVVLFKLADLCHDEGVRDNAAAAKLAEKYFRRLLELEPGNARALALLGSTLTLRGRDAFWPKTQIDYVKKGNKTMDEAVERAPADPEVRFIRAINNFHMPKFLGREEIVQADFQWLWERARARPGDAGPERIQEIALHHGLLLKKQKTIAAAITVWEQGLEADPDSTLATRLSEELKRARKP